MGGKKRAPAGNKARQPGGGKANLDGLVATIRAAQGLIDSEGADALIGEPGEEYRALIQATQAAMTMSWAAMKAHGARETATSLQMSAQSMTIVLDLVHKAFALGVRDGQGRAE